MAESMDLPIIIIGFPLLMFVCLCNWLKSSKSRLDQEKHPFDLTLLDGKNIFSRVQRLKGILHQKFFYRLNLIFWIVMGCGIADLGRRGRGPGCRESRSLGAASRGPLAPRVEVPCAQISYTTPHYYPKYEI